MKLLDNKYVLVWFSQNSSRIVHALGQDIFIMQKLIGTWMKYVYRDHISLTCLKGHLYKAIVYLKKATISDPIKGKTVEIYLALISNHFLAFLQVLA